MDRAQADLLDLARDAVRCRVCFESLPLQPAFVDLAQRRWVGPRYWSAEPRIVVILVNPGAGRGWADQRNEKLRRLLREFASDQTKLDAVLKYQRDDLPNWGRGRFWRFYIDGVGLDPDQIALANNAWCATRGNRYPSRMLSECFSRHTARLLSTLVPEVVILAGAGAQRFARRIERVLPACNLVETLHYSHRKGLRAQTAAIQQVKQAIAAATPTRGRLTSASSRPA